MDRFKEAVAACSKDIKERVVIWLRNEGLITSSRASEPLETSVSKIIEMSNREKETCETCFYQRNCQIIKTERPGCPEHRRIVEKEDV